MRSSQAHSMGLFAIGLFLIVVSAPMTSQARLGPDFYVTGSVKAFDEKMIKIVTNGHAQVFPRAAVPHGESLRSGKNVTIKIHVPRMTKGPIRPLPKSKL